MTSGLPFVLGEMGVTLGIVLVCSRQFFSFMSADIFYLLLITVNVNVYQPINLYNCE